MKGERIALGGGAFAWASSVGLPRATRSVLVLPALGMPAEILAPFAALLGARRRVVVAELPGSGSASGLRAGTTTRDLARDAIAVLDGLGIARAHLFGISLGGMIAQWALLDAPDRIDRAVLASTAASGARLLRSGALAKLALVRHLPRELAGVELARRIVSQHVRDDAVEIGRIERAVAAHPRGREEIVRLGLAALRHDTRDRLGEIRAPVLVLAGDGDVLVPLSSARELAAAIPGARELVVPGAGHDVTLDQPERTAHAVAGFLEG